MEESTDIGGFLWICLCWTLPQGRLRGNGEKNRTPQNPQVGLVDLRTEKACVLCQVEPVEAAKPWSSHCSACWEETTFSVLVDTLGISLQGFLEPQQGAEASKVSSWAFSRTRMWLAESSWLDETVVLGWGWWAVICTAGRPKTIAGWGCPLHAVCTGDDTED